MEDNNGVVVADKTPALSSLSLEYIDKLDNATIAPIDLMSSYWSPESKGESKRVIFDRIAPYQVIDQSTGQVIELESVFFYTKENGNVTLMRNASKRLVGAIQSFNLVQGSTLIITYLGKIPNKTNGFKSDDWSVKPLVINATP